MGPEATRISDYLKSPKTVMEIIDFALENHIYCTNAICEILLQLYHTEDFKVLVLVD